MVISRSRVTSQGQISVPREVRAKLGIGPGSLLEWEATGEIITVRRLGKYSSSEIRMALFPDGIVPPKTLDELKDGIRQYVIKRYARD